MGITTPLTDSDVYAKVEELYSKTSFLRADVNALEAEYTSKIDRYTYGTFSDIARGVHCPSRVLDLVIGNVKRGRELKSLPQNSTISFRYGFSNGELIQIEKIFREKIVAIEFLFRTGNERLGVDICHDCITPGLLTSISQEQFDKGALREYNLLFCPIGQGSIREYRTERYCYDEQGLSACNWQQFMPLSETMAKMLHYDRNYYLENLYYTFERCDGFLKSFRIGRVDENGTVGIMGEPYPIRRKRNA